jgi:hypothetical protein
MGRRGSAKALEVLDGRHFAGQCFKSHPSLTLLGFFAIREAP